MDNQALHAMTVVELRQLAKEKGLKVPAGTAKAALVGMLADAFKKSGEEIPALSGAPRRPPGRPRKDSAVGPRIGQAKEAAAPEGQMTVDHPAPRPDKAAEPAAFRVDQSAEPAAPQIERMAEPSQQRPAAPQIERMAEPIQQRPAAPQIERTA